MRRLFALFGICLALSLAVYAQPAQCRVTATAYLPGTTQPDTGFTLYVYKIVLNGSVYSSKRQTFFANSSGVLIGADGSPGVQLPQGSVAWLYANFPGFDANPSAGTPYSIPNLGSTELVGLAKILTTLTSTGDLVYGGTNGAPTRLPGNTSTTLKVLGQVGTGVASQAPAWYTPIAGANITLTPDHSAKTVTIAGSGGGGGGGSLTVREVDGSPSVTTTTLEVNQADGFVLTDQTGGVSRLSLNAIPWARLDKTGSSLADLTTRSAADLSSGTLPDGRFPATLPAASGVNLTALNASNLGSGTVPDARFPATLPAISGANLTNLNASNLASGTVPLARLSGITNAEIAAGAAIAYSKLALTGSIVNTDINASAALAWSKIDKTGSSLADLATRSAGDLSSGTLAVARGGTGQGSATNNAVLVGDGSGFVLATIPSCSNGTNDKLLYNNSTRTFTCGSDQTSGGGGGISTLNTLTAGTQTFSKTDDTNVTLTINSASADHNFALGWTGTLAAGRLNSNVVQAVTNDTNVTGSISSQTLTLGWTGTLAKARQHANTVYTDQANTFGAFVQTFQAGANHLLVDPTDTTKKFQFDVSNVATSTTRTVNIPNANSTTVQADTGASNQFLTAISAQGVISKAQPAFSNLSGTASAAQIQEVIALADLTDVSAKTGTGSTVVMSTSPSLTTPVLGVASATSITLDNTGLLIKDTNASHNLNIKPGSNITADRALTLTTGDADRTLTLSGDATISGTNTGDQTITLTSDVTGSGTGSFATTIANDAVTFAKMQNLATDRLVGRDGSGSGDAAEIALAGSLTFTGSDSIQLSGDSGSPGNSKYYGTDSGGTKGFFDLPAGASFANPTATIGLSAVNGVATTAMRSDAAPVLSQSIAPTWSGLHTFNSGATPGNVLLLDIAAIGSAGTRDSHNIILRGRSDDSSAHSIEWREFNDVTSNAGASTWTLQSRIDAASFANRLTVTDGGAVTAASFSGDGSALTSLAAGSIASGTLANARLDSDLQAIGDNSTSGIYARTSVGSVAARTIIGTSNKLTVTDGDGIAGNPTLTISDTLDLTGNTSTAPIKSGTSAPGTCSVGQYFYDTDATAGQNTYACTATNTWTLQGDGGGGGGSPGGSNTQVQYNSSGSFAGAAGFVFDGTSALTLGVASTSTGKINLAVSGDADLTTLQAGDAPASAVTYKWPADDPAAEEALRVTSFSGGVAVLRWSSIVGGSNGDFQINGGAGLLTGSAIAQGSTGRITITPTLQTSGINNYFRIITPADTGQTASTEVIGSRFGGDGSAATVTRQWATGALSTQRENAFIAPTYAFVGASTLTTAVTVDASSPIAGTNATITNSYAGRFNSSAAGHVALVANSAASPTANIFETQINGSNTGTFQVSSAGKPFARGAGGSNSIQYGSGTFVASVANSVMVGDATNGEVNSVSIGYQAGGNGGTGNNIMIGYRCGAGNTGSYSIYIGADCNYTTLGATRQVLVGAGGYNALADTIALGYAVDARSSAGATANMFIAGSGSSAMTDVFFGKGVRNATPTAYTINGTGFSGSNGAGAALNLAGGKGTGTGVGGSVALQTSIVGSSGSTANTLITRYLLNGARKTLTDATDNSLFEIALPTLTGAMGTVRFEIFAGDGTDVQVRRGTVQFSAVNKGGTYTSEIVVLDEAASASSGTLTATWNILTGTNKVTVRVNPSGSLTETTLYIIYTVENNSEQAITVL